MIALPFAEPAWNFTGYGGTTTLWVLPCRGLVVPRRGDDPKQWDTSTIPNLLLTGSANPIKNQAAARSTRPAPAAPKQWSSVCGR